MAEIASAYPTAGGLYYWASKLGSPGWGWFTGWFNLIGQIAVTAAIGYGLAIFATALLNYWFDYPNSKGYVYLTYAVVLLVALILNLFRVTVTALLNTISAYWHMIGVAIVVIVLFVGPGRPPLVQLRVHRDAEPDGLGRRVRAVDVRERGVLVRVPDGPADGAVHDHGLRRVRSRRGRDALGVALGCGRDVHVRRRLGVLRVHPPRRGHEGAPAGAGLRPLHRSLELGGGDGRELGDVHPLHLLRRAALLPDRLGDVGLAHAVRVLARPRRSRPPALAPRLVESRSAHGRHRDRALRRRS